MCHKPVPQTMYWSQTERESWSLIFMFNHLAHPFNEFKAHVRRRVRGPCLALTLSLPQQELTTLNARGLGLGETPLRMSEDQRRFTVGR